MEWTTQNVIEISNNNKFKEFEKIEYYINNNESKIFGLIKSNIIQNYVYDIIYINE